jgi:hypothetical protein
VLIRLAILLSLAALVGCDDAPTKSDRAAMKSNREARVQRAQDQSARTPPKVTRHKVGDNELLRLDVLTPDELGFIETQHCYVWRDAEFRTASMTCPAPADAGVAPASQ